MKEFIFYTHEGITTGPNINTDVENCQLLGREVGDNLKQAQQNFIRNNLWIEETGFDINAIQSFQIINDEIRQNIQKLLEYIWMDKQSKFEEGDMLNDHISMVIQKIKDNILNDSGS